MKVQEIMKQYDVTLSEIAHHSGISKTTLSGAFNRPVESWSIRILNGVAKALHESPSDLLKELQEEQYEFKFDDEEQTIMGVKFEDEFDYQAAKFAIYNNVIEGWEPTKEDVAELKAFGEVEHPELESKMHRIFGEPRDEK